MWRRAPKGKGMGQQRPWRLETRQGWGQWRCWSTYETRKRASKARKEKEKSWSIRGISCRVRHRNDGQESW